MNRVDLRTRLYRLRAIDSSGTTQDGRMNELMNVALQEFASDIPEALVPDEEHAVVLAPVQGTDATILARVAATADRWVLRFTTPTGGAMSTSTVAWRPIVDGTWDGIMHIEANVTGDTWARRQSREWWSVPDLGAGVTDFYVTLDRPWRNTTDTAMNFWIYQPEVFTRANVMRILAPMKIYDSTRQQVWPVDTGGSYRQDMFDFRRTTRSRPYRFWRNRFFQMPTPTEAPTVALSTIAGGGAAWAGPVQEGTFTVRYTFVWGNKDPEWQTADYGTVLDPQWESAPSPASAAINHADSAGRSIVISPENIEAMTNFFITGQSVG